MTKVKCLQLKGRQLQCWHKEGYELNLARICLGTELVSFFLSCMQVRVCQQSLLIIKFERLLLHRRELEQILENSENSEACINRSGMKCSRTKSKIIYLRTHENFGSELIS